MQQLRSLVLDFRQWDQRSARPICRQTLLVCDRWNSFMHPTTSSRSPISLADWSTQHSMHHRYIPTQRHLGRCAQLH